jgi:transcriptional regulator with XRE-family HTH domain
MELAEQARVDNSTISRIENQRSQATLHTAATICLGLRVHLTDFAKEWIGESYGTDSDAYRAYEVRTPYEYGDETTINAGDILRFLQLIATYPERATNLIVSWLNRAEQGQAILESTEFYQSDVKKLQQDSRFYSFELKYPPRGIGIGDRVLGVYRLGGAISQTDIATYILYVRAEAKRNDLSDRGSRELLERLQAGFADRVKLMDVIELDVRLGSEVLGMYWRMLNLKWRRPRGDLFSTRYGIHITHSMARLVKVLVLVDYWRRYEDFHYDEWLEQLRYDLE